MYQNIRKVNIWILTTDKEEGKILNCVKEQVLFGISKRRRSTMKRRSLKFIACAAIMAMTLSVTACGGSDDAAPAAETEAADDAAETETPAEDATGDDAAEAETETEAEDEAEPETEETEDEGADTAAATGETVESLLNDPAVKAQYEEKFAEYEEQGMTVSVSAKGNELMMSLTFKDASQVTDEVGEQLQAALDDDAMASVFSGLAGALDSSVGGEAGTCTYSVSYLDPDGNVLAEKSYTAK
jgi:hypothetical protein